MTELDPAALAAAAKALNDRYQTAGQVGHHRTAPIGTLVAYEITEVAITAYLDKQREQGWEMRLVDVTAARLTVPTEPPAVETVARLQNEIVELRTVALPEDPTPEMCEAGVAVAHRTRAEITPEQAHDIWQAMIDVWQVKP